MYAMMKTKGMFEIYIVLRMSCLKQVLFLMSAVSVYVYISSFAFLHNIVFRKVDTMYSIS